MPLTVGVEVPPADREVLEGRLRSPSIRAGLAARARIVLLAASWKHRYAIEGLCGLDDRPKPGRPQQIDETAVVLATLEPPPERLGVTHWSSRLLGKQLGLSNVMVAKVWKKWGLQRPVSAAAAFG
jgi:hypothetical protein